MAIGKAWRLLKVIAQPSHFPLSGQLGKMQSREFLYFQGRNIKALLCGAGGGGIAKCKCW